MSPVIYDACVLYPARLRDFLLRLAAAGLVHCRWTEQILDESFRSIQRDRPELDDKALRRTRQVMNAAFPDALVTDYEKRIGKITLPDPDDRHVVAAAVESGAQFIVTFNLRDFPKARLSAHDVEAVHPDAFIGESLAQAPAEVCETLSRQARALRNPPMTVAALLDGLDELDLHESVARLRELLL